MILNCTPHSITFRDMHGVNHVFPPCGHVMRSTEVSELAKPITVGAMKIPVVATRMDAIEGIPPYENDDIIIVSTMILEAAKESVSCRVVSPATGPNDDAIRNEDKQIIAVTKFKEVLDEKRAVWIKSGSR